MKRNMVPSQSIQKEETPHDKIGTRLHLNLPDIGQEKITLGRNIGTRLHVNLPKYFTS